MHLGRLGCVVCETFLIFRIQSSISFSHEEYTREYSDCQDK